MTHRIALLLSCLAIAGAAMADEITIGDPSGSTRIGGTVEVLQPVEGPLRAAAGKVTIDAPVDGSVQAAAGKIEVGPGAVISGKVSLAGGSVTVAGTIHEKLRAAGGTVKLNGRVDGDVSIAAGSLELGPEARIAGRLVFRGEELRRDPAAQVAGGIERFEERPPRRSPTVGERFAHGWIWTAGLMMLAALIAAAVPGLSGRMARELRERPWLTPLLGLVALSVVPVAAVLLMVTIIGIPLALLALAAYAFLLLAGYVWIAVVVGALLLERINPQSAALTAWRVGAAVLATLALGILARLPFVGHLVQLVALVAGLGMIVAVALRRRSQAGETPMSQA